ncbi:MAG TPA: hypothetical protein VN776_04100 [Terracidiphilus sp.]|nr:hypothetical protein [Terracidiphilus sp.]
MATLQHAMLSARLGEAWIKVDAGTARHQLRSAVRAMELQAQNGDPGTAAQRAETVRILLKIIMPLDRSLGERLLKLQTTTSEPAALPNQSVSPQPQSAAAQPQDRWQQTRQFLDAAQSVVNQDPKLAASLASNIIKLRGSKGIESLFGSGRLYGATVAGYWFSTLRSSDPATADRLFMDAVSNARTDYDYSMIFALSEIAFPTVGTPGQEPVPATLQSAVSDLIAEAMLRPSASAADMSRVCGLSSIAARLSPFFDPSQAAGLQSAVTSCQGNFPTGDADELQDALLNLRTSADYWAAAQSETALKKRVHYKLMAATKALREDQDPVRALEIWDSFSAEERAAQPTWLRDRGPAAEQAILEYYKLHDARGVALAIEHTPPAARPKLQLALATTLFAHEDRGLGTQMLTEARRTLERVEVDDPDVYLTLLTTHARFLPAEAPQAFSLAVSGLNRIPVDPPAGEHWKPSRGYDFSPLQFGPSMLDMDADLVRSAINTLASPVDRARFRLGYIHGALERYAAHAKPPPAAQPEPPRQQQRQ